MLVRPKVVVALEQSPPEASSSRGETPLSALRGTFHTAFNTPVRVTYNPSYLLRTEDISESERFGRICCVSWNRQVCPSPKKQRS